MQQTQSRLRGTNSLLANVIKGAVAGAIAVYVIDRMERLAERSEVDEWYEPTDAIGYDDEPAPHLAFTSGQHQLVGLGLRLLKDKGMDALASLYAKESSAIRTSRTLLSDRR
ncbi:hypothetical protein [Allohahella marinimesophila]|uniref:Uncharacterized protein n=1 Tax=Allohahella marinimesophila TaxID=1054972 RepID=A0ABP7P6Y1_9GAMM